MSINIKVAEIICKIESGQEKIIDLIKKNCDDFLSNENEDFLITLNLREKIKIDRVVNKNGKVVEILGEREKIFNNGKNYFINSDFFNGNFDINKKKAIFDIKDCDEFLWLMIRNLLRVCYAIFAFNDNGFLMHCSCVVKDDKGYLFCGKPGAGKSTVAKLSNSKVLSDESLIIKDHKGTVMVYGTPFGGELKPLNEKARLDKLFFLVQSKETYFEELKDAEKIAEFMQNEFLSFTIVFNDNKNLTKKIFKSSYRLLKKLKCYKMHFAIDNDLINKVIQLDN